MYTHVIKLLTFIKMFAINYCTLVLILHAGYAYYVTAQIACDHATLSNITVPKISKQEKSMPWEISCNNIFKELPIRDSWRELSSSCNGGDDGYCKDNTADSHVFSLEEGARGHLALVHQLCCLGHSRIRIETAHSQHLVVSKTEANKLLKWKCLGGKTTYFT